MLLIGRDLIDAHHVENQITGPQGAPFAQKLSLGWVIVGQVCTGKSNGGILSAMELRCECNFATSGVGISEASFGIVLHSNTVGKV
jgi:hypothetical protein